ncbi:MAG: LysM peptidoglycan-binding domain-containing protein [Bacilli bacterium]
MKKIIPFRKEIIFKTNVSEITSISLEHTLQLEEDNFISGKFIVSGSYKMTPTSVDTETFTYDIPCDIRLDEKYILKNITIDIDDFYYEIINDTILSVNIEVKIDKIEEKIIKEKITEKEELEIQPSVIEKKKEERHEKIRCIEEESNEKIIASLFDNIDESNETYQSYTVYIVREGDTIESIIQKYNITIEEIGEYNDIKEFKLNDKLIIPTIKLDA